MNELQLCETQNCLVTVGAMAFITLVVRNIELRFHWCCNGFQLHMFCEEQNCVIIGGAKAYHYTCCAKIIALSLVEQPLSITLVMRNTELRCY